MSDTIELSDFCKDVEDYTFFKPAGTDPGDISPPEERLCDWAGKSARHFSYDCTTRWADGKDEPRLLACRCFQGTRWSITVRGECKKGRATRSICGSANTFRHSNYRPGDSDTDWKNGFLFPVENIVDMIGKVLLDKERSPQGLLLVAGATKSAKTLLARGLIHRVLKTVAGDTRKQYARSTGRKGKIRRPHLVTFEDPIEKWFWGKPEPDRPDILDYTPRQRGLDVFTLRGALHDALRQTPTVFYIGEIREVRDWEPTIEFAGTGHLVVATAHGGSLTETINKICKAIEATTAAQRNYIADRLLGVVHVRLDTELPKGGPRLGPKRGKVPERTLVGSLWHRTPAGVHALTSGGLSSLLCANPDKNPLPTEYCLGQSWWVRRQLAALPRPGTEDFQESMIRRAMYQDLEGE